MTQPQPQQDNSRADAASIERPADYAMKVRFDPNRDYSQLTPEDHESMRQAGQKAAERHNERCAAMFPIILEPGQDVSELHDPEAVAIDRIARALEQLSDAAQVRVLNWAMARINHTKKQALLDRAGGPAARGA